MENNTFNLKSFREGCLHMTQADFAKLLGMRQDAISRMEKSPEQITLSTLMNIAGKTGMTLDQLIAYKKPMPNPLKPLRTWGSALYVQDTVNSYLTQKRPESYDPKYETMFEHLREISTNLIRKPKFVFLGRSDSGKSTMINALLGKEVLPTSWTPTTSIVVYLKHIEDRPSFIKDELWIFKKGDNGDLWDDSLLSNEEECKSWKIAGGNAEMLASYGTRKGECYREDSMGAAVLFIESDALKNCDFMDVPGFTGGIESDNVSARKAQSRADALIYLSPANGFLSPEDFTYLKEGIGFLTIPERKNGNKATPLANLYIVATQAHIPNGGNPEEIRKILDSGAERFTASLTEAFWCNRKEITGYDYGQKELSARFFSYTTDISDLRKDFEDDLMHLIEFMPSMICDEAIKAIKTYCADTSLEVRADVSVLEDILYNYEKKVQELHTLQKNEPKRKLENAQEKDNLLNKQNEYKHCSHTDFQTAYNRILSEGHIIGVIEDKRLKSKKDDMHLLCSYVNSEVEDQFNAVVKQYGNKFSKDVENYITSFSNSCTVNGIHISGSAENFNAKRAFASGLTGAATLGALGFWASTLGNLGGYILVAKGVSLLSALGISVGGTAAAISAVAAIGGPITVGIGIALVAATAVFGLFSGGWKKKAAKKIIAVFEEQNAFRQYGDALNKFWNDTNHAFLDASVKMEAAWEKELENLRATVENFDKDTITERIRNGEKVVDFFSNIPL